jgi:hypothetical protein
MVVGCASSKTSRSGLSARPSTSGFTVTSVRGSSQLENEPTLEPAGVLNACECSCCSAQSSLDLTLDADANPPSDPCTACICGRDGGGGGGCGTDDARRRRRPRARSSRSSTPGGICRMHSAGTPACRSFTSLIPNDLRSSACEPSFNSASHTSSLDSVALSSGVV